MDWLIESNHIRQSSWSGGLNHGDSNFYLEIHEHIYGSCNAFL